jgi:hypothetical protein
MPKLTRQQREFLAEVREAGYVLFATFPRCQRNKCGWRLVDLGLLVCEFGPRGSFLQTYCFMLPEEPAS